MADVTRKRALDADGPVNARKKLRPSELPLSQAKRSAIDSLVHTFRKKGQYDTIRKELMAQYVAGVGASSTSCKFRMLIYSIIASQRRACHGAERVGRSRD